MDSLAAELMLLRKRVAVWILLSFWTFMAILFSYLLPYYAYTSGITLHDRAVGFLLLEQLLPSNFVGIITGSFPFFGGTMVLILGVLSMGSEFSWGTLTPVFTQRASRIKVFGSKMAALAIALVPFVLSVFILGLIASLLIALREGQPTDLPPLLEMLKALGACWLILAVWASFGVLLAVISRGTALAIGLGIIYGLVLENIISAFGRQVDLLNEIAKGFLRTNSYSLISSLGGPIQSAGGPGGFIGPALSGTQSLLIIIGYIVFFTMVAGAVMRWRDVAGVS
jgi:ABC-type transport system involved in multi-copper enzyme maturation permease subunit